MIKAIYGEKREAAYAQWITEEVFEKSRDMLRLTGADGDMLEFSEAYPEKRLSILNDANDKEKARLIACLTKNDQGIVLNRLNAYTVSTLEPLIENQAILKYMSNILKYSGRVDGERKVSYYSGVDEFNNWKDANHLPDSIVSLISIALIEERVDHPCNTDQLTPEERHARYDRVSEKLAVYRHKKLNVRNLEEALLIQVIRGLYEFDEIPDILNEFFKYAADDEKSPKFRSQKSLVAAKGKTDALGRDIMSFQTRAEMDAFIEQERITYLVDKRNVSKRIESIYKRIYQKKGYDISLENALKILSPMDNNFLNHITKSRQYTRSYTEQYLLQPLIRLEFEESDIREVLEANSAIIEEDSNDNFWNLEKHMIKKHIFIDKNRFCEYLEERSRKPFDEINLTNNKYVDDAFKDIRYVDAAKENMVYKIAYAAVFAEYLRRYPFENSTNVNNDDFWGEEFYKVNPLPPPDYFLSYMFAPKANQACRAAIIFEAQSKQRDEKKWGSNTLYDCLNSFNNSMQQIGIVAVRGKEKDAAVRLYNDHRIQFSSYYRIPEKMSLQFEGDGDEDASHVTVGKLHYFAAVTYSMMTGCFYTNRVFKENIVHKVLKDLERYGKKQRLDEIFFVLWKYFLLENTAIVSDTRTNHVRPKKRSEEDPQGPGVSEMSFESIRDACYEAWKSLVIQGAV